jgi:hypothetical protein
MVRRIFPVSGIDLVDLALSIHAHPQRSFGPRHAGNLRRRPAPGSSPAPCRFRIYLVDVRLGDLVQVFAVPGRARVRGDMDARPALPLTGSTDCSLSPVAIQTVRRRR